MQIKESKRFIDGGMNQDVDASLLPESDYIQMRNGVVDEKKGLITNIKGLELHGFGPDSNIRVVYAVEWKQDNSIIYFSYSSSTSIRYILKYNRDNNTVQNVFFSSTLLTFDISNPVKAANIIDGILYWTQGSPYEPYKLNIEKAINFLAGSGSPAYTAINTQTLSAAQYPPLLPPKVQFATDDDYGRNNLRGKLFQFCYRYIMEDNEVTSTSPFSKFPLPLEDEGYDGEIDDLNKNNYISVSIFEGGELVKAIEVFAREKTTGDWTRIIRMDKDQYSIGDSELGTFEYRFYNDVISDSVDQSEISAVDSGFPVYADAQEIIDEGILAYGGVTEGYDSVEIDVEIDSVFQNIQFGEGSGTLTKSFTIIETNNGDGTFDYSVDMTSQTVPSSGSTIEAVFDGPGFTSVAGTRVVSDTDVASKRTFLDFLQSWFDEEFSDVIETGSIVGDVFKFYWTPARESMSVYTLKEFTTTSSSTPPTGKRRGFKIGATHPFGIVYFDINKRSGGVNSSPDSEVVIPFYTENHDNGSATGGSTSTIVDSSKSWTTNEYAGKYVRITTGSAAGEYLPIASNTATTLTLTGTFSGGAVASGDEYTIQDQGLAELDATRCRAGISWEVKHLPPSWATHWAWVYAGNQSIQSWIQYILDAAAVFTDTTQYTEIDISALNQHSESGGTYIYPQSSVVPYVFNSGDRIRFITEVNTVLGTATKPLGPNLTQYLDLEILGYKDNDPTTNKIVVQLFDHASLNLGSSSLVEIYAPRKDVSEKIYYGMGDLFEIGNPGESNRYHKGKDQDQDPSNPSTTPATGILYEGDSYIFTRSFSEALIGSSRVDIVESQNMSDFYDSDDYTKGKAFVVLDNPQQKKYRFVRWSNKYFADTQINGLNVFEAGNRTKQLDESDGDIIAMSQSGFNLRVLQEKRPSTIYIGRAVIESAGIDGAQISTSNQVLGTIRPQITRVGTLFPNSVYTEGNDTYFFDIYNGNFYRMSENGANCISDYGMKNWFRDKSRTLLSSGIGNIDVITIFDRKHDSLIVTFRDYSNSDNDETIIFYEPRNRWITFADFKPEMYRCVGDKLYSFNQGAIYEHDSSTADRMLFYGSPATFSVTFSSNIGADKLKVLNAIGIETNNNKLGSTSTDMWSIPSVIVPESLQYPSGQFTKLNAQNFKPIQNRIYADFLRDGYTTTGSLLTKDLITGRMMLNNYFKIKLQHQNTELVDLGGIIIYSTPAEFS